MGRDKSFNEARFYFEDSSDNAVTVTASEDGSVAISVSEEHAVDSYNATFECTIVLRPEHGMALRDYLNKAIKDNVKWQRVNEEPFEYAIQEGAFGEEFVKLPNGSCLRRSVPPLR